MWKQEVLSFSSHFIDLISMLPVFCLSVCVSLLPMFDLLTSVCRSVCGRVDGR